MGPVNADNGKRVALYYPYIEIRDHGWLLSAALFWDGISTITPNEEQPYSARAALELFDAGILTPYRATPQRAEIKTISEKILELIVDPHFEAILGTDHWVVSQSRQYPIYPEKIESNLRTELERLGRARERPDGLLDMQGGLAAAYMLLLSTEVAEQKGYSLVTDSIDSFKAAEIARFPNSSNQVRGFPFPPWDRQIIQREFVDACINEMIVTWFRLDPDTSVKKIITFRNKWSDELERLKNSIFRFNSSLLTEEELTREVIQDRARTYVHSEIQPQFDELLRLLKEEKISFIPDTLEAALYSELPGGMAAMAGGAWAVIAAPLISSVIRTTKFFLQRGSTLKNSPWSYLYRANRSFSIGV